MIVSGILLSLLSLRTNADINSHKRIIGGEFTTIDQHNYQVLVESIGVDGRRYICGGCILSERHVLTAAHCYNSSTTQRVIYATSYSDGSTGTPVSVTHIYLHPYFYRTANDIAIFKLKDAIKFSRYANKINLPEPNYEPNVGSIATVTGWGREYSGKPLLTKPSISNKLKRDYLQIIRNDECATIWSSNNVTIYDTNLCTSTKGRHSTCSGDSGGGLVLNGKVIGIVSFGAEHCYLGIYPTVFTRVSKYVDWIKENLKK